MAEREGCALRVRVEPASGRLILASRQNLVRGCTVLKNLDAPLDVLFPKFGLQNSEARRNVPHPGDKSFWVRRKSLYKLLAAGVYWMEETRRAHRTEQRELGGVE
jgi:hypothetical protein